MLLLAALPLSVPKVSRETLFGVVRFLLAVVLRETAGEGAEGRSISVPLCPLRLDLVVDTTGCLSTVLFAQGINVGARVALELAVRRVFLVSDC